MAKAAKKAVKKVDGRTTRPTRYPKQIMFRASNVTWDSLNDEARAQKTDVSSVVRDWVEEKLQLNGREVGEV